MTNLFPKLAAILLGGLFLFGGVSTAFGAEYFFHYNERASLLG